MTVMVTGGAGFIGSRVVRKLVERGEPVVSFGPTPVRGQLLRYADAIVPARGDIARLEDVLAAVQQHKVRRIIHMASFLTIQTEAEPYRAFLVSGVGLNNVLEVARWTGVERVVYASSVAYYAAQGFYGERPINEDDAPSPSQLYGALKVANEMAARRYSENDGLDACAIRISTAFGHGQPVGLTGWARSLMSLPAVGQPVQISVAPQTRPPFCYVDDIADMLVRAIFAPQVSRAYVCGGYRVTIGEVVDIMRRYLPDAQVSYGESTLPFAYMLDHSRAKRELGWDLPPPEQRVLDHINEARAEAGLEAIAG